MCNREKEFGLSLFVCVCVCVCVCVRKEVSVSVMERVCVYAREGETMRV